MKLLLLISISILIFYLLRPSVEHFDVSPTNNIIIPYDEEKINQMKLRLSQIPTYNFNKTGYILDTIKVHASHLKPYKVSQHILQSFPLGPKQNGHINEGLKHFFDQDKKHPDAKNSGFMRKGILVDSEGGLKKNQQFVISSITSVKINNGRTY